jgi:hypothetical protein
VFGEPLKFLERRLNHRLAITIPVLGLKVEGKESLA